MLANKEFAKLDFKTMVDTVAGDAILKLVKGDSWNSIFYQAAVDIVGWKEAQLKK